MKLNDASELVKDGFSHADCPDGWEECNAARSIVYHLLDPTPVTGEALVAMGWRLVDWNDWWSPESNSGAISTMITFKNRDNGPRWRVNGERIGPLTTLGQVRCACLAFGIPMREGG